MSHFTIPNRNTVASNMQTEYLSPIYQPGKGFLLREHITFPPIKRGIVISGRYISSCSVCGDRFGHMRKAARYCSDACRVKAARIRNGRCRNRREAAQQTVNTKHSTNHLLTCECCGREFYGNGYDVNIRKYCGDACKQKAYRQRLRTKMQNTHARNTQELTT